MWKLLCMNVQKVLRRNIQKSYRRFSWIFFVHSHTPLLTCVIKLLSDVMWNRRWVRMCENGCSEKEVIRRDEQRIKVLTSVIVLYLGWEFILWYFKFQKWILSSLLLLFQKTTINRISYTLLQIILYSRRSILTSILKNHTFYCSK